MVRKQLAYFSPACHNKTTRVIIKQKQKQEHSSPWTTASRKHGNGAMKTAVSLTPPDGKGTALNTMLTDIHHPRHNAIIVGQTEGEHILWGTGMHMGASGWP